MFAKTTRVVAAPHGSACVDTTATYYVLGFIKIRSGVWERPWGWNKPFSNSLAIGFYKCAEPRHRARRRSVCSVNATWEYRIAFGQRYVGQCVVGLQATGIPRQRHAHFRVASMTANSGTGIQGSPGSLHAVFRLYRYRPARHWLKWCAWYVALFLYNLRLYLKSYLNIPPHLKYVATLPPEIWMPETGGNLKYVLWLMINHKIVCYIAKHLSSDGLLHYKFITQYFGKITSKISEDLAELQAIILPYYGWSCRKSGQHGSGHGVGGVFQSLGLALLSSNMQNSPGK